jgi:hypothetical protein
MHLFRTQGIWADLWPTFFQIFFPPTASKNYTSKWKIRSDSEATMEDTKEPVEQAPNGAARREKLNRHNTVPLLGVNDKGSGEVNILMEGYPSPHPLNKYAL